jgi:hypothetical protein
MTIPATIDEEMRRLLVESKARSICMRLIGGLAIKIHCPSASLPSLTRDYSDFDLVTFKEDYRKLPTFFTQMGYIADKEFNTLNGTRRQIYYDTANGHKVDVFIGDFEMCHNLPLSKRLHADPLTIPLAELFLSKTQIVYLTRRDVIDMATLLLDHPVEQGDAEVINIERIVKLCVRDWGLYTTTIQNLDKMLHMLNYEKVLDEAQTRIIAQRVEIIKSALGRAKKSLRWQVRNKVGRRVRWYAEVEELNR